MSHPDAEALTALRNARLWQTHADRYSGGDRDDASREAALWSEVYQARLTSAPTDDVVPFRRGDRRTLDPRIPIVCAAVAVLAFCLLALGLWLFS